MCAPVDQQAFLQIQVGLRKLLLPSFGTCNLKPHFFFFTNNFKMLQAQRKGQCIAPPHVSDLKRHAGDISYYY